MPVVEKRVAVSSQDFPPSSVGLDWLMGVLSALLVSGIVQDGWAHAHGKVDQSFFTPWHAILYSMMALNGFVLGALALRNARRGHSLRHALPYGYGLALAGVMLFAAGGVLDLLWHTVFGIEEDLDALLSPTHLLLALAAMLIFSGPLRSIGRQNDRSASGWLRVGPVVPALLAILILFGFFLAYAQPIEDGSIAAAIGRKQGGPVTASLYALDAGGALIDSAKPRYLGSYGIARRAAHRLSRASTGDLGERGAADEQRVRGPPGWFGRNPDHANARSRHAARMVGRRRLARLRRHSGRFVGQLFVARGTSRRIGGSRAPRGRDRAFQSRLVAGRTPHRLRLARRPR
jgi:hypothetical protein